MQARLRNSAVLSVLFLISFAAWAAKKQSGSRLTEQARALHALNRLTFGTRPGDVDRVLAIGVDKWIDRQLHPDKIDDSSLNARISGLRTINMDTREIVAKFPPQQLIKAAATGKMQLPSDPAERAIYLSQIQRMQEKKQNAADAAQGDEASMSNSDRRETRRFASARYDEIMALPADKRMDAILKMSSEDRREFATGLRPQDRLDLYQSLSPEQREQLMALRNPQIVAVTELQQAKILRAVYSERQLEQVLTDFWFNHFNVFINKGSDRYLTTAYERDVIRPHVLGKFKDLLIATAKSPAMLFYLDNWQSVGPDSDFAKYGAQRLDKIGRFARGRRPELTQKRIDQIKKNMPKGLNENYARELMELHTLGVDGGYTQHDVTEVAKVFTGWTIKQPRRGGEYEFDHRRHEPGPKFVLGRNISEHGEKEGIEVLEMLARSPSTARFISKKLAMRFVSDGPPQSLIDQMSATYLKTDGDIREVLRTMFHSKEFWAPEAYRAKVKTPFEFVVSAIRATNSNVTNALPLIQQLNKMGMPLYGQQPPTGYSMKAGAWVNSAALLDRMNFGLALGASKIPGVGFNPQQVFPAPATTSEQTVGDLENALLAGDVSRQTHDTIMKQLSDPQTIGVALRANKDMQAGVIVGLILGSPEFQRR